MGLIGILWTICVADIPGMQNGDIADEHASDDEIEDEEEQVRQQNRYSDKTMTFDQFLRKYVYSEFIFYNAILSANHTLRGSKTLPCFFAVLLIPTLSSRTF